MLKHKSYTGHVVYDDEARIFYGEVLGIRAVITFQGTSADEIETSFRESVEDYLDWCSERGKDPEKPFSGRFNLRLPIELHAQAAEAARCHGMSLNQYVQSALRSYLDTGETGKRHASPEKNVAPSNRSGPSGRSNRSERRTRNL